MATQSQIAPLTVRRGWEAYDAPSQSLVFVGDPDGRLIEIAAGRGHESLLMDRRLALKLAQEIVSVAGPAEDLPSDGRFVDIPYVVKQADGSIGLLTEEEARGVTAAT